MAHKYTSWGGFKTRRVFDTKFPFTYCVKRTASLIVSVLFAKAFLLMAFEVLTTVNMKMYSEK